MAYAFCAMYPHYEDAAFARTVWWGYDYNPTREQYERVCFVIRHASQYNRRGRLKKNPSPATVPCRPISHSRQLVADALWPRPAGPWFAFHGSGWVREPPAYGDEVDPGSCRADLSDG